MATPSTTQTSRPGSLTQWLRGRTDAQLAQLLRRRPDLALPAPADIPTLATRLAVRSSVQRAIDGVDAFTLRTLEAVALTADGDGRTSSAAVTALLAGGHSAGNDSGPSDDGISQALATLYDLALIWGDEDDVHLVAVVRDVLGPYPAGLGRPFAQLARGGAPTFDSAEELASALAAVDGAEREILDRLATGPPVGLVRAALLPGADESPPHRLIARGLLVPIDSQTVELPREVGLALRSHTLGDVAIDPPDIAAHVRTPDELDRLGTTAVLDTVRQVEVLGETWTGKPPGVLRAGGIGVRDLRRTARDLAVDDSVAALVVEVANAAGLVGPTNGIDPVYLPTPEFDAWRRQTPAQRWGALAAAWLAMTRQPSLIGQRGERERLLTALGPDIERGTMPGLRVHVLEVLTSLAPGAAPVDRSAVLARLVWEAPRRAKTQRPLAEAVLVEADQLGVTAAGGLTGYSRTLLHGSRSVAEQVLTTALPEPVDHFVVQPDLTIVVPGPPTATLGAELALVADLESTGGANVYRITEASVRRALDADRTASDVTQLLTQHSRTPIPQALTYLIDDVARRHGVLRAGLAASYLRCDDEALLARVVADRATAALGLRRIAPTVVVCDAPVTRVLDGLRAAGYAPAGESADGAVVTLAAEAARAPSRPPGRSLRARAAAEPGAHVAELVRRIRGGDSLTTLSERVTPIAAQFPGVTSATTMGVLREAIRESRRVWLGYASPDGSATRHTILPISMAGGVVRGHESDTERLQSFALHRITAVTMAGREEDES